MLPICVMTIIITMRARYEMVGERTGKVYKLGQEVRVSVCSMQTGLTRTIDFVDCEGEGRYGKWRRANGKMIANNKKAYHDYFILDTYEAGIALSWNRSKVPSYG